MDFMRMREAETELSLEESPYGTLRMVRRYRPGVLVREAARGAGRRTAVGSGACRTGRSARA